MPDLFKWLIIIAMASVVFVLGKGLVNMMRNGSASTSQNLMRWRVVLQFIAVMIMMGVLLVKGRG